jgi:hypothetical protein
MVCVLKTAFTLIALLLASGSPAWAQPMPVPGAAGHGVPPGVGTHGPVESGVYNAGDSGSFTLESYGAGKYLLRFAGHAEISC